MKIESTYLLIKSPFPTTASEVRNTRHKISVLREWLKYIFRRVNSKFLSLSRSEKILKYMHGIF